MSSARRARFDLIVRWLAALLALCASACAPATPSGAVDVTAPGASASAEPAHQRERMVERTDADPPPPLNVADACDALDRCCRSLPRGSQTMSECQDLHSIAADLRDSEGCTTGLRQYCPSPGAKP